MANRQQRRRRSKVPKRSLGWVDPARPAPVAERSLSTREVVLWLGKMPALDRLETVARLRAQLDQVERSIWRDSYRPDAPPLAEFGRVLGITKQAAWNRRARMASPPES